MNRDKLLVGFLTATIGLLMLLTPEAFAKFSVILLGGATVINGILIIFTTRNLIYDEIYNRVVLVRGLMSLAVGTLAVALPLAFAEEFLMAMAYTLGAHLVLSSILLSFTAFKLRRNGIPAKTAAAEIAASLGIAALLVTILALISPDRIGMTLVYVFGGILVLTGLAIVLVQWLNRPSNVIGVRPAHYVGHTPAPPAPAKEAAPAPTAKSDAPAKPEPKSEPTMTAKADAPSKPDESKPKSEPTATEKTDAPAKSEPTTTAKTDDSAKSEPTETAKADAPEKTEPTATAKADAPANPEPTDEPTTDAPPESDGPKPKPEPAEPKENPAE